MAKLAMNLLGFFNCFKPIIHPEQYMIMHILDEGAHLQINATPIIIKEVKTEINSRFFNEG